MYWSKLNPWRICWRLVRTDLFAVVLLLTPRPDDLDTILVRKGFSRMNTRCSEYRGIPQYLVLLVTDNSAKIPAWTFPCAVYPSHIKFGVTSASRYTLGPILLLVIGEFFRTSSWPSVKPIPSIHESNDQACNYAFLLPSSYISRSPDHDGDGAPKSPTFGYPFYNRDVKTTRRQYPMR